MFIILLISVYRETNVCIIYLFSWYPNFLTVVAGDAIVGWFPAPVVGCTPSPATVDPVSGDQATTVAPDPTTCYAGMANVVAAELFHTYNNC